MLPAPIALPDATDELSCAVDIGVRWTWTPPMTVLSETCPPEQVAALDEALRSWSVEAFQRSPIATGYLTVPATLVALPGQPATVRFSPAHVRSPGDALPAGLSVEPSSWLQRGRWPAHAKDGIPGSASECHVTATVTAEGTTRGSR